MITSKIIGLEMATSNSRRNADAREDDLYTTPPWAVRALMKRVNLPGIIVDAGCGTGNIINTLVEGGYDPDDIITVDKYSHDYTPDILMDYCKFTPYDLPNTVITNPPFKLFTEFVNHSLSIASEMVCVFARINSLETATRFQDIYKDNPPSDVYLFVERVKCAKGGKDSSGNNSVFYCWLVWNLTTPNIPTILHWISEKAGQQ